MKKRIQKKKQSKILEKYEPLLENMFGSVLQLAGEINPTEYRTQEAKIKETLEKQFDDTHNSEQFAELFLKLFATVDFKTHVKDLTDNLQKEINENIEEDERFAELFKLVKDAESKCPNIGFLLFFQNNPLEVLAKALEPYDLIQQLEKQKGEKASRTAVRLYREVAELLYDDYLKVIYGFVQILEGKKMIKLTNKFGNLTAQLPLRLEKLGYKNLVVHDAGKLRNATCHGHWRYKPEAGKIVLWDLKKDEQELSPPELTEKAMHMYRMVVQNYLPLILIYLGDKVCSKEWLSILKYLQTNWKSIMEGNKKKTEHIERMIEGEFSDLKRIEFKL